MRSMCSGFRLEHAAAVKEKACDPSEPEEQALISRKEDEPSFIMVGPCKAQRVTRIECQMECEDCEEDCVSGHCGATFNVAKPESIKHRQRCKHCRRIFRPKQLQ